MLHNWAGAISRICFAPPPLVFLFFVVSFFLNFQFSYVFLLFRAVIFFAHRKVLYPSKVFDPSKAFVYAYPQPGTLEGTGAVVGGDGGAGGAGAGAAGHH